MPNTPPFVGHLAPNPALAEKRIAFNSDIEGAIKTFISGKRVDLADSRQVAAALLLGMPVRWDAGRFRNSFEALDLANPLNDSTLSFEGQMEKFQRRAIDEKLWILSTLYKKK